ncbi:phosphonate ABC transporter, permease protein PhnE [Mesorhizobium sp. YM1C-6-2]|uniref:phosphonate ABC transporter, permease protein PhnE n=1 Tax=Mesorhizobium sp. YM1C-6-2 TaxID=1827501 RepID=UPI000EF1FA3A|nr:phosphonate ABC transporter, permease protein PhnE [Mesorhizobium sp. YM1C-6-2]RLP28212.1 phosphonate ABC transporter, permease protein PhnE [Mesorhizobium sp. YM1C-6-2]
MTTLAQADVDAIAARHPAVFAGSRRKQMTGWLVGLGVVAYLCFAWWFFAIGSVLANGNWGIAGVYLADWVSYETRPRIEFGDEGLEIRYPRFSAYNRDRHPDWVELEDVRSPGVAGRIAMTIGDGSVDIAPGEVIARRGSETVTIAISPEETVSAAGPLPSWAEQDARDGSITISFGFRGSVEVEADEVKVRQRFWGWENFVFDANSPFWGKSFGEVVSLVFSDERIKPEMSNAALAWNNILNNAEWQHGDVWLKLGQTIVMAFVGTVFASLLAFPLAFAAARNITRNVVVNQVAKRLFDFLRSVDMLIWALFFTRAFGPGPLAGISAIFFTDTGTFGKLYSEALENIDDRQREGIKSVGAAPVLVQRYGVVPQVLPIFISQSLYFWESNTRSATIIGAVGAGGIGLKLWEAMRTNSDWENVAYMVLLILAVVFVFDNVSNFLRKRLTGQAVR